MQHGLLAGKLGTAVGACGVDRQIFGTRGVERPPAKDVIGRDMHQQSTHRLHGPGKNGHRLTIDTVRHGLFGLGFVHIGVCGTIDDGVYLIGMHIMQDIAFFGDVQLLDIGKEIAVDGRGSQQPDVSAKLTVGTGYQNVHQKGDVNEENDGWDISLGESSTRSAGSFQSMARVSSFQAIAPSLSGA